ncbi:TetR family transcriptional regulator C-terminal domain-containing protein [Methylobacterium organophilum]|uniref:HTH-type transcriptional regulator RutR n=1 Tax=Methylobacterium organophilum TaxID=410 RepID=A0ABQ4T550_METOR|nr:TetR family transcriptional regulator C-terminal domain-containing protein [Methylobacterium organophilum]UMY16031.1 TetR family transcriptional regulator C-terminal domain-containing protein [Methylobacterium organophilum]GJE25371.1 HTH-type transcriptional regulator RutR [Methylobacterium organophilum]
MEATRAAAAQAKARIRARAEERILDAAAEIFAREGRAGATMAAIADAAAMAAATVHYYYGTKAALYDAVLDRTLSLWLTELACIDEEKAPADAIADYIRAKMRVSQAHSAASRIVAGEVLNGSRRIAQFLEEELKPVLERKLGRVHTWQLGGALAPVDARHLFFLIWAATEFYANSAIEVATVLGHGATEETTMEQAAWDSAAESIIHIVLHGVRHRP